MTDKEIIRRLTSLPSIGELNAMQKAVIASNASALAVIAPTGSGKTLAFAGRLLKVVSPTAQGLQAVVIAPSRELVLQVASVMRRTATGLKTLACYGGHPMREEIASIAAAMPAVIVATPGRLLDHLQRGTLAATTPRALVLDEYDKSLELGFADEMSRIARRLGIARQVTLTSATRLDEMPPYLSSLRPTVMDFTEQTDAPRRRMEIVEIESPARDKLQTLTDLLRSLPQGKAIVFVNHRESAQRVYDAVRRAGLQATLYHGAMDQPTRETAVDLLANGTAPIMIATDLAARGLDIEGLNHIIHYHLPADGDVWTHRNGRTARQQAEGTVYVITSEADNLPEFITFDRQWTPQPPADGRPALASSLTTIRFDAGRKEKLSRGDIVGFLTANTSITGPEIGLISLHDHHALVAVPASKASEAERASSTARIKGKKVRARRLGELGISRQLL